MSRVLPVLALAGLILVFGSMAGANEEGGHGGGEDPHVKVASWNWHHVGVYVTITLFILFSGLAKVGFHHLHFISSRIPESCLLVVVGVGIGAIIVALDEEPNPDNPGDSFTFPEFTPELFFFLLLPPIILEAAYSLYERAFFDNLSTILLMAVVGTAFNFVVIGLLLYGVFALGAMGTITAPFDEVNPNNSTGEYELQMVEVMTFASLISAVDPVAVLAIFQEVGVNAHLYFLLFGESLLNDGVAVVLYNMMNTFAEIEHSGDTVTAGEISLGLVSFFTVALGGLSVGIIIGLLTALFTKYTTEVRVVEPLAMFGMAYLSYITAELFHWSGIISLIGCGLVQAHYAFKNISKNSYTTIKYFISMLSATSDCIIFLFLGIAVIKGPHYWHTGFTVWTISFTLIVRFIGTYGLTFLANRRRVRKVNLQEQFIMAYGGLRGAVGFSLVEKISNETIPPAQMFVTTTLAVVMFTIFIQGGTIKFLVNLLDIDKKSEEQKMLAEQINETVFSHILAGIDVIVGKNGSNYFGRWLSHYDEKYLMRVFCKKTRSNDIINLLEELAISDHLCNLYGPTVLMDPDLTKPEIIQKVIEEDAATYRDDGGRSSVSPSPSHTIMSGIDQISSRPRSPSFAPILRGDVIRSSFGSGTHPPPKNFPRRRLVSESESHASVESGMSRKISASEREALKQALINSPYNKYHHRYNPNLIHDEEQELETHLRRRHTAARRLSSVAMMSNARHSLTHDQISQSGFSDGSGPQNSSLSAPKPRRHTSMIHPTSPYMEQTLRKLSTKDRAGVEAILSAAEAHANRNRTRTLSASSNSSPYTFEHDVGAQHQGIGRTTSVPARPKKISTTLPAIELGMVKEEDDGNNNNNETSKDAPNGDEHHNSGNDGGTHL